MSWDHVAWSTSEPLSVESKRDVDASAGAKSALSYKARIPQTPAEMKQWLEDIYTGESLSTHAHLDTVLAQDFLFQLSGRTMNYTLFTDHIADFRQYWKIIIRVVDALIVGSDGLSCHYLTEQKLPRMNSLPRGWDVKYEVMLLLQFDERTGKCRRWLAIQRELKDEDKWPSPIALIASENTSVRTESGPAKSASP